MLRHVLRDDLPILFAHQREPDALRMAAFASREWDSFLRHWQDRVLAHPSSIVRTIVSCGAVAGYVLSYEHNGARYVGYWLGQDHWGKGIATAALAEFLHVHDTSRPLQAYVAASNVGSIRVLEKCGFVCDAPAAMGSDGVVELVFRLHAPNGGSPP